MKTSNTHRQLLVSALSVALLALAPVQAQAQAVPKTVRADPMDAQAEVPPLLHRSAFAIYRAAGDGTVGNWQEANQAVNRIGGWRAYAREAAAPGPAPARAPAAAAAAAAPGAAPVSAAPAAPAATSRSPAVHAGHGQP